MVREAEWAVLKVHVSESRKVCDLGEALAKAVVLKMEPQKV